MRSLPSGHPLPRGRGAGGHLDAESRATLATDDRDWRGREDLQEERYSGDTLFTRWLPWPDVEVTTWLAPALPGHVRVHRVRSPRSLRSYEGGFSVSRIRETFGHRESVGFAEINYRRAFSAIRDLTGQRQGKVTRMEPSVNVLLPLTSLPGRSVPSYPVIRRGGTIVLECNKA